MDVIGGLTAAKMALDLAKDLREIDKSVDEAIYKMKLAELMSALADTQVALADAKNTISNLEEKLENERNGKSCPICKDGRLTVTKVEASGTSAIEFHHCDCTKQECDYKTSKMFDSSMGEYVSNHRKRS